MHVYRMFLSVFCSQCLAPSRYQAGPSREDGCSLRQLTSMFGICLILKCSHFYQLVLAVFTDLSNKTQCSTHHVCLLAGAALTISGKRCIDLIDNRKIGYEIHLILAGKMAQWVKSLAAETDEPGFDSQGPHSERREISATCQLTSKTCSVAHNTPT